MSLLFPEGNAAWQRFIQQILIQHHVDLQRLWKRVPQAVQPDPGCPCPPVIGEPPPDEDEIGTYGQGSGAPPGTHGASGGTAPQTGVTGASGGGSWGSNRGHSGGTGYQTYGSKGTHRSKGSGVTGWNTLGSKGTIRTAGTSNTNLTGGTNTGGTQTNDCCSGVDIDSVITATLTTTAGCSCITGQTIDLTWTPSSGKWEGTGAYGTCGNNVTLKFYCVAGGTGLSNWRLDVSFTGGTGSPCRPTQTLSPTGTNTCSPLSVAFRQDGDEFDACGCSLKKGSWNTFYTITE